MPIDNPLFAHILAKQLMDAGHRRAYEVPIRHEIRELQQRTNVINRLRRAVRRAV